MVPLKSHKWYEMDEAGVWEEGSAWSQRLSSFVPPEVLPRGWEERWKHTLPAWERTFMHYCVPWKRTLTYLEPRLTGVSLSAFKNLPRCPANREKCSPELVWPWDCPLDSAFRVISLPKFSQSPAVHVKNPFGIGRGSFPWHTQPSEPLQPFASVNLSSVHAGPSSPWQ